jgi:hypothetical protein
MESKAVSFMMPFSRRDSSSWYEVSAGIQRTTGGG